MTFKPRNPMWQTLQPAEPLSKWASYFKSLRGKDRRAYCKRAGLSQPYIEIHLVRRRKSASVDTIKQLAEASQGAVTPVDVFEHFAGNA